jgi:hypothetical protein
MHEAKQYISKQLDPAFYNNVLKEYPFLKQGTMAKIVFGPLFFCIDILRFWKK